ncbi:hypothetical protein PENANT_c099G05165 [Penicillium antarcticum]|uniref:Uncharacterized protein n=1 Tax=Penicillium antarcticum TaxID=416450 RepID=A0A1V6PB56_9EURO|nr:hypothetical protein PENANT_c181G06806 [Penicillium antarcticum]OQD78006.1 hypothetical protein PENANT_c099G05165 [Penicillium antarcticum]
MFSTVPVRYGGYCDHGTITILAEPVGLSRGPLDPRTKME